MRFLGWFIIFFAGLLSLWIFVIWGQAGNPTRMSQWVWDAYEKKGQIADRVAGQKIIIAAGSNALFGVDSKMLSQKFGLPVVNDGVNAGVELPVILWFAKQVIDPGDIVIVPLEYPLYSYTGKPSVQMIDFIFSRIPEFFRELTLKEQLYMLWHVSSKRLWEGYFDQSSAVVTAGLYGAHHIDGLGDQNETEVTHRSKAMQEEIQNHISHPETYGEAFDPGAPGWDYLSLFVLWCQEREVKVIFVPSTIMYDESYAEVPKEKWFYTHIADVIRKKGWIFAGDPYDYMYDETHYFNTNFHLIDSARKIRTKQMIDDLSALPSQDQLLLRN